MILSVRAFAAWVALAFWSLPAVAQPHTVAAVRFDRTNLRAQPSTDAEVLASLHKGELVEVLGEEVPAGQKEIWSRVVLPSSVMVWLHSPGVDKAGVIRNEKVNLRAGPGKNYSILGSLNLGESVVIIREFDDWLQIAPPRGTSAYVASRLLASPESIAPAAAKAQTPPPRPARNPSAEPPSPIPLSTIQVAPAPPESAPVPGAHPGSASAVPPGPSTENPHPAAPQRAKTTKDAPFPDPAWASIAKPVSPEPKTPEIAAKPPTPASSAVPSPAAVEKPARNSQDLSPKPKSATLPPARPGSPRDQLGTSQRNTGYPVLTSDPNPGAPKPGTPLPEPREVTRDGIVQVTWSPQAPSDYELRSVYSGEGILNYLYLEPQSDLKKFAGKQVRVHGEEYLDSRWRTPVLKVKTIELNP